MKWKFDPEVRRGGGLPFGQFVCQWVCDPRYTTNLRTLYSILVTYADIGARDTKKGKPYRQNLAAELGCSVKTLDRTVEEGECAGLFWVEKRPDPDNPKLSDSNIYHLRDAEFWRGEWVDPLQPGQKAEAVAAARRAERVAAKRAAGILPKGGRKKKPDGVASPMTPPPSARGSVTHDATPGVTHDATGGVSYDALSLDPSVENQDQEPSSVRPSVRAGSGRAGENGMDGGTDGGGSGVEDQEQGPVRAGEEPAAADAAPDTDAATGAVDAPAGGDVRRAEMTQGVEVLRRMGRQVPRLKLAGPVLLEQGRQLEGLIAGGWTPAELLDVLSAPFDGEIRTSAAAIVASRIRALPMSPNSTAPWVPMQASPGAPELSTTDAAGWTVTEAVNRRASGECRECGRPPESGLDLCAVCAGWPLCACGLYRTPDGGTCDACQVATAYAPPEPDGLCTGRGGECGVPVMEIGPYGLLCGPCEFLAARDARRRQTDWEAAVQRAKAAVAEDGATPAPF